MQVVADLDGPAEVRLGECSPVIGAARRDRWYVVGQDQRGDTRPFRGLRCFLHRGVVVEGVLEARHWDGRDDVLAQHGVDEGVCAEGESIEACAGHGVAGDDDACSGVIEPEGDRGLDGPVVGRRTGDCHRSRCRDGTVLDLDDLHRWAIVEVFVVREAIANVGLEGCDEMVHHVAGPRRADDRQRCRLERRHPSGGDNVVQVGDVVAVQVGQEHSCELPDSGSGEAHQHAPAGVDEEVFRTAGDQAAR